MVVGQRPDFFSLTDILATQERVPFVTNEDLPKLGFLDLSAVHQEDPTCLLAKTSLELPLWMVWALRGRRRVRVDLPKTWTASQRQILIADPKVIDLHALGPYFYDFGCHLLRLIQGSHPDFEEISNVLVDTFTRRFRSIMDSSVNAKACDTLCNTSKLDELERALYELGQCTMKTQEIWSGRSTDKLHTSAMVRRHLKRKLSMMS